jgi:hypothetical protein
LRRVREDLLIDVQPTDREITIADRWTYVWGARRRPFIHPLRTPSGVLLTRDAPDDHPWHHGLWFTIKFVNGENFWEEYDDYGVLRHDGPPVVTERAGSITAAGELHWIRPDRSSVIIDEQRRITHLPMAEDAYAIDFETTIEPRADVVLDRTPFTTWGGYGGLALRGHDDWSDTRILLADGSTHDQVRGRPARWCDLSSPAGGVAWLDHPGNPRHPVPWYGSTRAETYGEGWANFLNAAFLWDEPLALAAGATLSFRYRLVVHDGAWDSQLVDRHFTAFAA